MNDKQSDNLRNELEKNLPLLLLEDSLYGGRHNKNTTLFGYTDDEILCLKSWLHKRFAN
ncbi:14717_t:CDS:2 [Cetraspora pellucida]|uniref:14717_t:CDS:1 n=1 Tax=Cetraspora pellucida TaxID=1433469 RepID=A0A9N9GCK2_9GLOM|nr:14717_t:CDS:2 [Cetraspora pellucida]